MALPVSHYLRVYKLRQGMAQAGITHPNASGHELINQLVERLACLDPSLPCHLVHEPAPNGGEWIAFIVEGEKQARLWVASNGGSVYDA
jgi:hypothetical protein